jgi:hypothetical protein
MSSRLLTALLVAAAVGLAVGKGGHHGGGHHGGGHHGGGHHGGGKHGGKRGGEGKKGCAKKCRAAAHSWSQCKPLVSDGECAFLQTEQGGVCIPGKKPQRGGKHGGGRGGKHGGGRGDEHERDEDRHGEEDAAKTIATVDAAFEADVNATDGAWSGRDFDPEEWFGEGEGGPGGRRGRHKFVHGFLFHALSFFAGCGFMALRARFCPGCGRCCCCKKKRAQVASVVPATVVVVSSAPALEKKPDPAVPSPRV